MNPWLVLDISETDDKGAIKRAYMSQLSKHNPEDDPEGFQKVREAYEKILAGIDKVTDNTPMGRFMKKVELLYGDFSQRVSAKCWKELLKDDICTQLATEDEAGKNILEFLMEHWYLPGAVLQALDAHFGWLAKKDELKAIIPAGFLDYIEAQMQSEYPRYDLFDTDKNPDRFIYLFFEVEGLINKGELDGIDPMISGMEETGVTHPCLLQVKARLALARGENEKALMFAKSALAQYPDDFNTRFTYAFILHGTENAREALPCFQELFNELPSNFGAERGIIECLISLEEYDEARELLLKAHNKYPSSAFVLGAFQHVSEMLIEKYLKIHQEKPEDTETVFTLAKHYLNRGRCDECCELLTKYASPGCHPSYYEYMGECLLQKGDVEKAVEYLIEDVSAQKKYRNYIHLAFALSEAQRFDDAIRYADEGLSLTDDDSVSKAGLYYAKGIAYHKMKQYDRALAAFDAGIAENSQVQHLYTGKANVYKDMNRYAEAIDCCAEAIAILPYNPEPYAIEMEIYLITNQYQRILEFIERTEAYNISESPAVKYYKACALARLSREDEALEILSELISAEGKGDEEYKPRYYREMAYLSEWRGEFRQAVRHLKKAIALDKKAQWPVWQLHLGRLYNNLGDSQEALQEAMRIFDRLIKEGEHGPAPYIERGASHLLMNKPLLTHMDFENAVKMESSGEADYDRIIQIYSDMKKHNEALRWVERELKLYDSAENRIQKAWVLTNLGRNGEAISYLEEAKKDFPGSDRLHRRLAYCYISMRNDHQKALGEYKAVLEINPEWPNIYEDMGNCLSVLGKHGEAIGLLTGAIEKAPDNVSLYASRGRLYMDTNRQREALADLLRAVTDTNMLSGYWHVHYIYYCIGHLYEEYFNDAGSALKYYKLSLELDNEYSSPLGCIGDIHFYSKNYAEAFDCYNKAFLAVSGSDDAKNLLRRANARKKLGQKRQARNDYKTALKRYGKEPDNACRHSHLGECYLGLGKYKKAFAHFNLAIGNAASCADCPPRVCHEAYFGLCLYYVETGQLEKAMECLETAIKSANAVQYNQYKLELAGKERGI